MWTCLFATVMTISAVSVMCASSNDGGYVRDGSHILQKSGGTNSENVTTNLVEAARGGNAEGTSGEKGGMKKKDNMFTKMLPFMVIPFLISSTMTPMVLMSLKFMLFKAAFVGKMAIILFLINAFWRFNNQGGVYSHNINMSHGQKEVAMAHYGYNGDEEYGAYIHR